MSGDAAPQRIVVVGGTSGMGFAAASILAGEGADVAMIGRDCERAKSRADALAVQTGRSVLGLGLDDAGASGLGAIIEQAIDHLGGLDGLAVTAGPIESRGSLMDLTDEDWLASFDTQLMTVVRATRAALPALQSSRGALVTIAAYSIRAQKSFLPHYAAMKSAVASLTKNIAKTYGPNGVRANCIAPGAIWTDALASAEREALERFGEPAERALAAYMKDAWGMTVALDRLGTPREVGELLAFLLSKKSAYLTGALINIDGGTDF